MHLRRRRHLGRLAGVALEGQRVALDFTVRGQSQDSAELHDVLHVDRHAGHRLEAIRQVDEGLEGGKLGDVDGESDEGVSVDEDAVARWKY